MTFKQLPVLLFFICQSAYAQISLEHTYPYDNIRRFNIDNKIFYGNVENNAGDVTLRWFDDQHQVFSVANFTFTPPLSSFTITAASSSFYDSDPGIESELFVSSGFNVTTYIVVDDDGTVLLNKPDGTQLFAHEVNGQKRVYYGFGVYAVPGFQLLHTFNNPGSANINFVNLQVEGPVYGLLSASGDLELYNAENFSLFQTYSGGTDLPSCKPSVFVSDRNRINNDSNLEWFWATRFCGGSTFLRYYSDATELMRFEEPGFYVFAQLFPDLFPSIDKAKILLRGAAATNSFVYDINAGQLEKTLPGLWNFNVSDQTDLLFFRNQISADSLFFPVLNADYSVWGSFPRILPSLMNIFSMSEATFDQDFNNKEALIGYTNTNGQLVHFIEREDGTILLQVDSMSSATVSKLPGFDNKLIFSQASSSNPALNKILVYSLPSATPVDTETPVATPGASIKVMPNPFQDVMRIDLSATHAKVGKIMITDALGRSVYAADDVQLTGILSIPASRNWPKGQYFISVQHGSGVHTQVAIKG